VHQSKAIQLLKDKYATPQTYAEIVTNQFGQEYEVKPDRKMLEYYFSSEEIWARSYSQYIAVKSQNRLLLDQLSAERNIPVYGDCIQWDDEDFAPIAAAIDELFMEMGWLQYQEQMGRRPLCRNNEMSCSI